MAMKEKNMQGWKLVHFSDTLTESVRNGIYKPKKYHGVGTKIVNMGELFSNNRLSDMEMKRLYITDKEKEKYSRRNGDLIFARRSLTAEGAGKCSLVYNVSDDIVFESSIIRARPDKNKASSQFLFYFFSSPYGKYLIGTILRQVAVAGITGSDLMKLEFMLPPLAEQKAIAAVLSSLDDKIDLLHRQNATLERMAETLFRQWFIEEAEEDWDKCNISDIAHINKHSVDRKIFSDEIKYLETGDINSGAIQNLSVYALQDAPSRAKRIAKHNDIIFSLVRPNQKHYGLLKNPPQNLVVSTGFCVLTCKKIDPHFLYLTLTTNEMTEYLHSIAEGSTSAYPSLKPSDIENLQIILPPHYILDKFSKYAVVVWEKIAKNQQQIRTLEKLRDTLLPKLMSGEVRVRVAE